MSTATITNCKPASLALTSASTNTGASAVLAAFAALLVTTVFIAPVNVAWMQSTRDNFTDETSMEDGVSQGSVTRQIALGSLGLFGLAALAWPGGNRLRRKSLLAALCIAYLAWCAASCLWSEDFVVSSRRFIALLCEVLFALAIARRASPRQFAWIVFACTLMWLGIGVLAEISLGTFRPWESGYRFNGIFHPNGMGFNCALLILASIYLAYSAHRGRSLFYVIAGMAAGFLFLTGSRTALGGAFVSFAALWVVMAPVKRGLLCVAAIAFVASSFSVGVGLGWFEPSTEALAMGRQDHEVSSLTGRLPLWDELLNSYVVQSPWIGHGYAAFWTADHIADISASQTWPIASSHSTYVDLLLTVGLIGALICLSAAAAALLRATRLEAAHPKAGYGFSVMVIVFSLVGGLLETTVGDTSSISFFGICGVCILLFTESEDQRHVLAGNKPSLNSIER